jgi:L-methionine (R)-S-oxide reductase
MRDNGILLKLKDIIAQNTSREARAARVAEAIRKERAYRWVGIYVVDIDGGVVSNIAWSGPNAPAYPTFPISKGLTSRAITERKTINVGDVAADSDYLTALGSTQSEIIVPVLNAAGDHVLGTIDVESEHLNAFDFSEQACSKNAL